MKQATLNLLPRKEFEITLISGEVIKGKYSLWAVKRFCDKKGLSLKELQQRLTSEKTTFDDVIETVLCAVEHSQRENKKPFTYTDFDVCSWIEELGGMTSENYKLLQGHAASEMEESEEKKTETSLGKPLKESATELV
jgi:hypothetical protein